MLLVFCAFLGGCKEPAPAVQHGSSTAYRVTDMQGTVVDMPAKPQRILTLSMSTDEIMLGLVEPEKMAAVNQLLDDPVSSNVTELAQRVTKRISNPTAEQVAALQPDLVIVPDWGDLSIVPSLRELGIRVVVCKGAGNLAEIRETILLLAQAAGEPDRGSLLLQKMDDKLAAIQAQVEKIPPEQRKTVVLISLMSAYGGSGCSFDEACHYAGVINGMAAIGIQNGQTMSKEQLVRINPDILFLPTYNNHGSFDVEAFRDKYLKDPSLQTVRAIQDGNLQEPFEGYIYNCSQDFVFGVQEIDYRVYGEAFRQDAHEHLSAIE